MNKINLRLAAIWIFVISFAAYSCSYDDFPKTPINHPIQQPPSIIPSTYTCDDWKAAYFACYDEKGGTILGDIEACREKYLPFVSDCLKKERVK
jgi:hypothetical protein